MAWLKKTSQGKWEVLWGKMECDTGWLRVIDCDLCPNCNLALTKVVLAACSTDRIERGLLCPRMMDDQKALSSLSNLMAAQLNPFERNKGWDWQTKRCQTDRDCSLCEIAVGRTGHNGCWAKHVYCRMRWIQIKGLNLHSRNVFGGILSS